MSGTPATVALYHDDSYLRQFDATVVAVESGALALDRTAFFPGGGGQMADQGALTCDGRTLALASLRKEGDVVWHEVAPEAGELPPVGAAVSGDLDWDFLYRMMRTHTALHLLCGLIFKNYGAQVTGGHMYPDRARMDFSMESFTPDVARAIEARVNSAIQEHHP